MHVYNKSRELYSRSETASIKQCEWNLAASRLGDDRGRGPVLCGTAEAGELLCEAGDAYAA